MTASTARARQLLVAAAVAVGVSIPPLLAIARWPQWWLWIASEQTPMTWLQSVVFVLAAVGALLVAHLRWLVGRGGARPWLLLAAGFGALAVDERFALHERVRDGFLAPRGVSLPFLPWVAPGDFLVMLMGLVGLLLLPMVWRAVRDDRASRFALLLGVVLAVIAIGSDSIDPSTWTVAQERVQQSAEEVVEFGSALALFACVGLRLLGLLGEVAARDDGARPPGSEPEALGAYEPQPS